MLRYTFSRSSLGGSRSWTAFSHAPPVKPISRTVIRALGQMSPFSSMSDKEEGQPKKPPTRSGWNEVPAMMKEVIKNVLRRPAVDPKQQNGPPGRQKIDRHSMLRLIKLASPEFPSLGIAVGTTFVTSGISLVFPMAIGKVLDLALGPETTTFTPPVIAAALIGMFTVHSALMFLRTSLMSISGERIAARIREGLYSSILSQEMGFFDSQRTGQLMTRLSADTVIIQKALTNHVSAGIRNLFMGLGGTGLLFYLSPKLALLSLSLIPPIAVLGMGFGRYMKDRQKEVQKELGKTMDVAEEVLSNMRTVRVFAAEPLEHTKFSHRIADVYHQARKVAVAAAAFEASVHFATNLALIAVLGYGGSLVMSEVMTAGELTSFLLYSVYVGVNLSGLSSVYADLARASGAAGRIFEIADRDPALPLGRMAKYLLPFNEAVRRKKSIAVGDAEHEVDSAREEVADQTLKVLPREEVDGTIRFENARFSYPQRKDIEVLKGLNLTVPAGKVRDFRVRHCHAQLIALGRYLLSWEGAAAEKQPLRPSFPNCTV